MFISGPAFPGGIRPPLHLARTRERAIRQMAYAPLLSLPLWQHADRAALPLVREGQDVERGDLIARASDGSTPPLHAPASGRIQRIDVQPGRGVSIGGSIHLAPFPGSTQEQAGGPACDPERASPDAIIAAIGDAGIVGPDGPQHTVHARLRALAGAPPCLLLISGIAGDAYLTRDYRILREQTVEFLLGLRYLHRATRPARTILALEQHDADAAQAISAAAPTDLPLEVRILPARYPQGVEPLLIATVLGQPLQRADKRALDTGVLYLDVASVAAIGRLLPRGMGCTDVVVTLAGGALDDPGNYRIPLGTPLRFALQQAKLRPDVSRILEGGPLRGQSLASLERPIAQGMAGFVALDRSEAATDLPAAPCIRCGDCLDACPVQLNPAEMGLLARKGEWQALGDTHALALCIECGCCAYVCPSRIPLVQQFRAAKARLGRTAAAGLAG